MHTSTHALSGKPPSSPLRVFIVEDSPAVLELVIESLADIPGLVIAGFADTERLALERLAGQACDVCIIDIQLKEGNGMSLLRKLVDTALQPDALNIIFSNNIDAACRREGERYGVKFFFDKTTEFLLLQGLLEDLASRAHAS